MPTDEDDIRAVIADYVTGFSKGDRQALLRAFHPRAVSSGIIDGDLQWDSAEAFAAFCEEAAPDPGGPVPPWEIETLCISGRTAIAVVCDQWGDRRFRDSLTLLRDGGHWRIVFKAFDRLP